MSEAINTNVRLFDLVRYMRSELHQADLITDEEYAWLCATAPMATSPKGGSPSARRLEDYDDLRKELTSRDATIAGLKETVDELQQWKESAMSVMAPTQEIGKALGIRLGESVHDKILPGIEALRQQLAAKEQELLQLKREPPH